MFSMLIRGYIKRQNTNLYSFAEVSDPEEYKNAYKQKNMET